MPAVGFEPTLSYLQWILSPQNISVWLCFETGFLVFAKNGQALRTERADRTRQSMFPSHFLSLPWGLKKLLGNMLCLVLSARSVLSSSPFLAKTRIPVSKHSHTLMFCLFSFQEFQKIKKRGEAAVFLQCHTKTLRDDQICHF